MPFDAQTQPLTDIEARVLATLMEKARTVPDSYPLSLTSLVAGCNQKTTREPVMQLSDAEVLAALEQLAQRRPRLREQWFTAPRATSTTFSAASACPSSPPCCWAS
jgi:uncharacterized protein YceH (UPF0502 family)